jgi:hypothetical protein
VCSRIMARPKKDEDPRSRSLSWRRRKERAWGRDDSDGERGKGWIACGGCGGSNGLAAHIDGLCWRACMRGGLPARGGGSRPPPAGCVGLSCGALLAFASFRYGFFLADCQILFVLGVCVCGGWVVFFLFAYAASFGCWLGKQLNP